MEQENILSKIIKLKVDGKEESVLPKDISFDVITDEPIHIDFLRVVKGSSIIIEIPVKFINNEKFIYILFTFYQFLFILST